MSDTTHITTNAELSSTKDNCLPEMDAFVHVKEHHIRELGFPKAVIYSLLYNLSTKYGYAFIHNSTIAEKFGIDIVSVEGHLKDLADRNLIYRNTYHLPTGGKKRHLVVKENAFLYWNNFLSKESIPDERKHHYLTEFLGMKKEQADVFIQIKTDPPTQKNQACNLENPGLHIQPRKSRVGLLNHTLNDTNYNQPNLPSKKLSLNQALKDGGLDEGEVQKAMEYYKTHEAMVSKKDNPVGWLIWALRNNKMVYMQEEKPTVTTQKEKAQKLAQDFESKISWGVFTVAEASFSFKNLKTGSLFMLEYKDPEFDKKIQGIREKLDAV